MTEDRKPPRRDGPIGEKLEPDSWADALTRALRERDEARAQLKTARADALEEAAKSFEDHKYALLPGHMVMARIRSLASGGIPG